MLPDLAQRAPGAPAPRPAQRLRADALGIGLRPRHVRELIEAPERVGYLEIISENFLGPAPGPRRNLARLRGRVPIVLHGVTLGLLDAAPLDDDYLDAVCRLADEVDAPFVTDHLCWTGHAGARHHDLLPTPHRADLVEFAAERAAQVQRRLGRPFGIENLSSYVAFAESDLTEWEFYAQVVRSSGCWFMFDLNNVHVSAQNHGFDPHAYVDAIDFDRVLQVHLAGHTVEPDGLVRKYDELARPVLGDDTDRVRDIVLDLDRQSSLAPLLCWPRWQTRLRCMADQGFYWGTAESPAERRSKTAKRQQQLLSPAGCRACAGSRNAATFS